MYKLISLDKKEYEKFVKNSKKSHFLQSYAWGEFSKEERKLTPYYLGLKKENDIVASALLLQKHLPLKYSYFYCPRGFILDYENEKLFNKMTTEIVKFVKKQKGIFLKIDPDIIRKSYNYLEEENTLSQDPDKIFKIITKSGFKHLGFTKNFETKQPRYTFRIDLTQNIEEIKSHFSKTTKQRINKAQKLNTIVEIGTQKDIHSFFKLMTLTEERKDFISYKESYYKNLYNIFNKDNKMTLFLGKVNLKEIIKNLNLQKDLLEKEIKSTPIENLSKSSKSKLNELKKSLEKTKIDIEKYSNYQKEYKEDIITINAHMIIEYADKAWVLYAGNHNILTDTYANYYTYLNHLEYCKERNLKIYDQFGTIGDLSRENTRLGLHEFKKKWGGDYIEFLGEFDYITNKFMYFIFNKLVPLYRNLIKKKSRKELKNEVSRIN